MRGLCSQTDFVYFSVLPLQQSDSWRLFDPEEPRFPIYKMGIITIATFQGFEDESDTARAKHAVRYLHSPC